MTRQTSPFADATAAEADWLRDNQVCLAKEIARLKGTLKGETEKKPAVWGKARGGRPSTRRLRAVRRRERHG